MRHSAAHVMAEAVQSLFQDVKFGIGPAIEKGFYYDFDLPVALREEDLEAIEARMREIISSDRPFVRRGMGRDEALEHFAQRGDGYKVELINDLDEDEVCTYQQGDFTDLCRGPHVESAGQIGPFKLLNIAGAYWRGDENRPMLQRIYGTAFRTQEELDAHLTWLSEVEKRDHRVLGRELDLFSIHPKEGGPGLIYWHPKGARIRTIIEDFWRREHYKRGYEILYTPHIAKVELWKRSGHWDFFRENMFPPFEVEGQEYLLKPMNCPFHILIYQTRLRSYRELPLRWAELGTVYRYERSGVLHGMLRARGLTQDDAHIFCRPDQLEHEVVEVIDLAQFMLESFGYRDYDIELSVRDPRQGGSYIGDDEVWDRAEEALRGALEIKGLDYVTMEGEAKFYGPAIDIKVRDALGRGWQGTTIQVDFNEPERFDVAYTGEDGQPHRAVMIHRTILGTLERFIGGLIEHYAGAFPVWLAPVQAVIIPIADRHEGYSLQVAERLRAAELRVEVDARRERLGHKIREAQLQKTPYMLGVGDREVEEGKVSVRLRTEEDLGARRVEEFLAMAQEAASRKREI